MIENSRDLIYADLAANCQAPTNYGKYYVYMYINSMICEFSKLNHKFSKIGFL